VSGEEARAAMACGSRGGPRAASLVQESEPMQHGCLAGVRVLRSRPHTRTGVRFASKKGENQQDRVVWCAPKADVLVLTGTRFHGTYPRAGTALSTEEKGRYVASPETIGLLDECARTFRCCVPTPRPGSEAYGTSTIGKEPCEMMRRFCPAGATAAREKTRSPLGLH
jgi:hypothetical protein